MATPQMITTTDALAAFCTRASAHAFVTIDTEFLRERSYYAKLCLIQMAYPETEGEVCAALIDPLAPDLDLAPLDALFQDERVVKVFHAARQDLEIFHIDRAVLPRPFFDTQIAAMVCGYGEQVGYETLVSQIVKAKLDKSSRFTDWSQRPLSARQADYALGDVTHLREIYVALRDELARRKRLHWVDEELEALLDPALYEIDPAEAWQRVKLRNMAPRNMAIVRELAELREARAQAKNIPRSRIYKDDALLEIASIKPKTMQELGKLRLLQGEARRPEMARLILEAVARGLACPADALPRVEKPRKRASGSEGLGELLRVLLKAQAEAADVAPRMIASMDDLDQIAQGARALPAFKGWRYDVFGRAAERLAKGEVALGSNGRAITLIEIAPPGEQAEP